MGSGAWDGDPPVRSLPIVAPPSYFHLLLPATAFVFAEGEFRSVTASSLETSSPPHSQVTDPMEHERRRGLLDLPGLNKFVGVCRPQVDAGVADALVRNSQKIL